MDKKKALSWQLEILWWLVSLIIIAGVLFPILRVVPEYPFLWINVLFILTFITCSRYLFLLRHTFLAKRQYFKFAFIVLTIPLVFFLVDKINSFQTFLDENGTEAVLGALGYPYSEKMITYVRTEMLFFGVGAVLSTVILAFRLVLSIWRTRNRGTV